MNSPKDNDELRQKIDDIVFRCFAQGQYWGSGLNKDPEAFDEDYRPENPIDRTEAVKAIERLISTHVMRARRGFADQLKLAMIDGKASHSVSRINEIIDQELAAAENFDHLKTQRKENEC